MRVKLTLSHKQDRYSGLYKGAEIKKSTRWGRLSQALLIRSYRHGRQENTAFLRYSPLRQRNSRFGRENEPIIQERLVFPEKTDFQENISFLRYPLEPALISTARMLITLNDLTC